MKEKTLRTERRLTIGFGLALTVLIANALASYVNIWGLVAKNRRVDHTRLVLNMVDRVVLKIREAESAQRSYLLTGDENDLGDLRDEDFRGLISDFGFAHALCIST